MCSSNMRVEINKEGPRPMSYANKYELERAQRHSDLKDLVRKADAIRTAQKAYMDDRGNEEKGRAVGEAARAYDEARAAHGDL